MLSPGLPGNQDCVSRWCQSLLRRPLRQRLFLLYSDRPMPEMVVAPNTLAGCIPSYLVAPNTLAGGLPPES